MPMVCRKVANVLVSCYSRSFHCDARMVEISSKHMFNKLSGFHRCVNCYMQPNNCICQQLSVLQSSCKKTSLVCHLYLYTHYKEYAKCSNTGKIIQYGFPSSVSTLIYGNPVHEALLNQKILNENTLILFPGNDSLPLNEVSRMVVGEGNLNTVSKPFNMIVIDSTWSQSKAMYRRLACVKPNTGLHSGSSCDPWLYKVHVDEQVMAVGPSKFANRKQILPHKSSTIESIAWALAALGEQDAVIEYCLDSLLVSVRANKIQAGKL